VTAAQGASVRGLVRIVAKHLGVRAPDATFHYEYADGSALHVARDDRDATCIVSGAGPDWAPAFKAFLMTQGLGELIGKISRGDEALDCFS